MPVSPEKRREYARNYYLKHKDELKDKYKANREKNAERLKLLRAERWLIQRYIPPEVQEAILYGPLAPQSVPVGDQQVEAYGPLEDLSHSDPPETNQSESEETSDTCSDQLADC